MIVLEPLVHETIWGGNRINSIYATQSDKVGHLYMVSGHENLTNLVANGKWQGKTLKEAFDACKRYWNMEIYDEFPLTIALVDASQNLSIQVHPDEQVAKKLEGKSVGKKESWLFLKGPSEGWIYGGCRYASIDLVRQAIQDHRMEEITTHVPIRDGQYACVSAGTLHAMTQGCFVYEIEYGSNFTYRFYDYDRVDTEGNKRPLQVDKAIEALKTDGAAEVRKPKEDEWLIEDVYMIKRTHGGELYTNKGSEIEVFSLLDGSILADEMQVSPGMSILLFPGEQLNLDNAEDLIIARLNR